MKCVLHSNFFLLLPLHKKKQKVKPFLYFTCPTFLQLKNSKELSTKSSALQAKRTPFVSSVPAAAISPSHSPHWTKKPQKRASTRPVPRKSIKNKLVIAVIQVPENSVPFVEETGFKPHSTLRPMVFAEWRGEHGFARVRVAWRNLKPLKPTVRFFGIKF